MVQFFVPLSGQLSFVPMSSIAYSILLDEIFMLIHSALNAFVTDIQKSFQFKKVTSLKNKRFIKIPIFS